MWSSSTSSDVFLRLPALLLLRRLSSLRSPETLPTACGTDVAASYLVSSCGLTPAAATKVAHGRKFRFTSSEKHDSVLLLLRTYGFTPDHISRTISRVPKILNLNAHTILKPKLEFFTQIGLGPRSLSSFSSIFTCSLERRLQPTNNSLVAALESAEIANRILCKWPTCFACKLEKRILPNLETIRRFSLPMQSIHRLAVKNFQVLCAPQDQLEKGLKLFLHMGFDPSSYKFVKYVASLSGSRGSRLDNGLQAFRDSGWKDEEALQIFKKYPTVFWHSGEKVKKMVRFFGEELKWEKDILMTYPSLITYSLEKRVMPRQSVIDILHANGEITRGLTPSNLTISEKTFENKFVDKYVKKYPNLLDAYRAKDILVEATKKIEGKMKKQDGLVSWHRSKRQHAKLVHKLGS